jgi:hypothetical protein
LADGRVLVAGGNAICTTVACKILATTAIYQPATGSWKAGPDMAQQRLGHIATLLLDGKVLVAGGCPHLGSARACDGAATAELFDPAKDAWAPTGFMNIGRAFATATMLPTGQVLVAGGIDGAGFVTSESELYDPATRTWTTVGRMGFKRYAHTATLLPDGQVLVAGGCVAVSELYDPRSRTWSPAGRLAVMRSSHTSLLLANGTIMITGGHDGTNTPLSSVELFVPAKKQWLE